MTPTVIEAGPGTIRRLEAGVRVRGAAEPDMVAAALDALDEPVTLVGEQPVSVDAVWRSVLATVLGGRRSAVIVHPSRWGAARVARVTAAARTVADDVVTRNRRALLADAAPETPVVVVEIDAALVVISGTAVAAEQRTGSPDRVAAAAARRVRALAPGDCAAVVVDAPSTVGGATVLARGIAERLRAADMTVHLVDDNRLAGLAQRSVAAPGVAPPAPSTPRYRPRWGGIWPAAVLLAVVLAWLSGGRPATNAPSVTPVTSVAPVTSAALAAEPLPTTVLIEGRIAVQVPAPWPVQRITNGPGSARVVLTSPSNPQIALHVTQSPVRDATMADTAAAINRALVEQPPGVFVDFTAAGQRAGRPAVTYREVRAGHDILWSILLDDDVRISIGCQSPTGSDDAVRAVCEQAVRSAHVVR